MAPRFVDEAVAAAKEGDSGKREREALERAEPVRPRHLNRRVANLVHEGVLDAPKDHHEEEGRRSVEAAEDMDHEAQRWVDEERDCRRDAVRLE